MRPQRHFILIRRNVVLQTRAAAVMVRLQWGNAAEKIVPRRAQTLGGRQASITRRGSSSGAARSSASGNRLNPWRYSFAFIPDLRTRALGKTSRWPS